MEVSQHLAAIVGMKNIQFCLQGQALVVGKSDSIIYVPGPVNVPKFNGPSFSYKGENNV